MHGFIVQNMYSFSNIFILMSKCLGTNAVVLKRANCTTLISKVPELKTVESASNVDPDEVAHYEPPHLDLHCLPSSL